MQILQLEKVKKPNKEVPVIVACLVLAILAVIFLAYPAYSTYKEKSQQLTQARGEVEKVQGMEKEVESVIAKIGDSQDKVTSLSVAIPDQPMIPDLYAHIENLAKSSNLAIDGIQTTDSAEKKEDPTATTVVGMDTAGGAVQQQPQSPSTLNTLTVNLGLKGEVPAFVDFLDKLGRSMRIIDVSSIGISTGETTTSFKVVLKTYYQKK